VAVAFALVAVEASTALTLFAPRLAQAKRARVEVTTRYTILDARMSHHPVTLGIGCRRHCSFMASIGTDLYVYIVSGESTSDGRREPFAGSIPAASTYRNAGSVAVRGGPVQSCLCDGVAGRARG
jgi:hypothetical protein